MCCLRYSYYNVIIIIVCYCCFALTTDEQQLDLRIVTVATKMNDKLNRLIENAEQFNINIEV